jgi:SH3-like domain-containing protein
MKKIIALLMFVLIAAAPAVAQNYASVTARKANIRACAGTNCAIKWYAWKYTPVVKIKTNEQKDWVLVKDFEGYQGWISADLLSSNGAFAAKVDVNVRANPTASADIVCTVEKGYPFKYLAEKGQWYQVIDDPEKTNQGNCKGWVYAPNMWGFVTK